MREIRSGVAKELEKLGCDLKFETMEVGDYCVSNRCCFERKEINDFFNSLFNDRKLFSQLIDLADSYLRPILIFEGGDPFWSGRRLHPKAVQGILNAIAMLRIPTLYSLNEAETALIISMIAEKEQSEEKRPVQMHGKRSHMSADEQREYVVGAIPDLGTATARKLLEHFKSVQAVFDAGIEQLTEVENVGPKTAERIREIVCGRYNEGM